MKTASQRIQDCFDALIASEDATLDGDMDAFKAEMRDAGALASELANSVAVRMVLSQADEALETWIEELSNATSDEQRRECQMHIKAIRLIPDFLVRAIYKGRGAEQQIAAIRDAASDE